MSHFIPFFGILVTVVVLADSYGYKFRRIPGTGDCRLQLNLPGYPPSYHSPIGSRYSEKFSGTGNSKVTRPGTGYYGQGSKYGSGSSSSYFDQAQRDKLRPGPSGSVSSTSTALSYGGYRPTSIANGDTTEYGSSGGTASWSGSKNQGSGAAYGSGSDGYNSYETDGYGSSSGSTIGNLNSGNDKSYNEGLKGYQTFDIKDMIECSRNEYYSKSLKKCILNGSNNDNDRDGYGTNYDRYGKEIISSGSNGGSSIESGSYTSGQQGYDQGGGFKAFPQSPPRVVASSSTTFIPNSEGNSGAIGSTIKNKGYDETANTAGKEKYGANGYGKGSSSGEFFGTSSGTGSTGYGTNADRDYDRDIGLTNSGSNSGTYGGSDSEQSYGSNLSGTNGGYGTNGEDEFPSSVGSFSASGNKGGVSGSSDTDFPDSSGSSYGSSSYDTNSNGNSDGTGTNYGSSQESYYGSSNNKNYGQQYGSTGSKGYGPNSEDDFSTSGAYGTSKKNYGTSSTGLNFGSQGEYGSQSDYGLSGSSSDGGYGNSGSDYSSTGSFSGDGFSGSKSKGVLGTSSNGYRGSSSNFNSQSDYGQTGFSSNSFGNDDDIKYAEEALKAHNVHRARHGSPPLVLDNDLSKTAQDLADKFALGYPFAHSSDAILGKYGESIAVKTGPTTGSTAVDLWYKEYVNYDFENPKLVQSPPTESNDNFSALVWRSTRKLGIGKSVSKDGKTFFVATYYPPGNDPSKLAENVFPARRI